MKASANIWQAHSCGHDTLAMARPMAALRLVSRLLPKSWVYDIQLRVAIWEKAPMDIVWQAEDSLREKKVESDLKDLLKTLVAFANSVAPDDTAQIFIGEKDDGTVQGVTDVDSIQKSVKKEADKIYPEIYYRTVVYERDGKRCVRVDIKRNGLAPHFGGAAWVRRGSVSVVAT